MGCVFRRRFHDKRTGAIKQIKTYSIKFQDASGRWLTEPTDCISKVDARGDLGRAGIANQNYVTPSAKRDSCEICC